MKADRRPRRPRRIDQFLPRPAGGAGARSAAASPARRRPRLGVELRHRAVARRRVLARVRIGEAAVMKGVADARAALVGGCERSVEVPRESAVETDRCDRAGGGAHHGDPAATGCSSTRRAASIRGHGADHRRHRLPTSLRPGPRRESVRRSRRRVPRRQRTLASVGPCGTASIAGHPRSDPGPRSRTPTRSASPGRSGEPAAPPTDARRGRTAPQMRMRRSACSPSRPTTVGTVTTRRARSAVGSASSPMTTTRSPPDRGLRHSARRADRTSITTRRTSRRRSAEACAVAPPTEAGRSSAAMPCEQARAARRATTTTAGSPARVRHARAHARSPAERVRHAAVACRASAATARSFPRSRARRRASAAGPNGDGAPWPRRHVPADHAVQWSGRSELRQCAIRRPAERLSVRSSWSPWRFNAATGPD